MLDPMIVAAVFIIVCALIRGRARRRLVARGYLKSQIDMSTRNRGLITLGLSIGLLVTWLARYRSEAAAQLLGTSASLVLAFGPALGFCFLGVGNLLDAFRLHRLSKSIAPSLPASIDS